jgi:hypothetical protein
MDDLSHALDHAAASNATCEQIVATLQAAAEQWAVYCLRTHRGELMAFGLSISVALVHYCTALQATDDTA